MTAQFTGMLAKNSNVISSVSAQWICFPFLLKNLENSRFQVKSLPIKGRFEKFLARVIFVPAGKS